MINLNYVFRPGYCGYYCLKYILGKVKCRKKNYLSLYDFKDILIGNGYGCICVRINKLDDVLFECVSLVKVNKVSYHYIVLKKKDNKYVYFYDPLFLFIRKMKIGEFYKKWSKICLFYTKV